MRTRQDGSKQLIQGIPASVCTRSVAMPIYIMAWEGAWLLGAAALRRSSHHYHQQQHVQLRLIEQHCVSSVHLPWHAHAQFHHHYGCCCSGVAAALRAVPLALTARLSGPRRCRALGSLCILPVPLPRFRWQQPPPPLWWLLVLAVLLPQRYSTSPGLPARTKRRRHIRHTSLHDSLHDSGLIVAGRLDWHCDVALA